jgi:hydrogenase expression/formation protein HypE
MASSPPKKQSALSRSSTITMSHGSGGKDMRDLIVDLFVESFDNDELALLEDQARLSLDDFVLRGDRIAFTTDSYVVDPIFFPGGNIGTLAVNGTINDLAVGGAIPLYLSCGLIIEEGFPLEQLRAIVSSMKHAADAASVKIVTGDTKVVEKNAADKVFINTTGVGVIPKSIEISSRRARPGDLVLINGDIGDHGAAILGARGDLAIESKIESDCQALSGLISAMLKDCPNLHCMRDATRGGVASVLNEIAEASNVCIRVKEKSLPYKEELRGFCEILGLDPLYMANEGKVVVIAAAEDAQRLLETMRQHELGRNSAIIGEVVEQPASTVILETVFGANRMVDKLMGEQLPRIC